eukprot:9472626-Pyramimonas_sp.AAC.1
MQRELVYIQFDTWTDAKKEGRIVELVDGKVKYREPGPERKFVVDFTERFRRGEIAVLLVNTTVRHIKCTEADRPEMRPEVRRGHPE